MLTVSDTAYAIATMAGVGGKGSRAAFECGPSSFAPETVLECIRRAGFSACEEVGFEELWRRYLPGGDPSATPG